MKSIRTVNVTYESLESYKHRKIEEKAGNRFFFIS